MRKSMRKRWRVAAYCCAAVLLLSSCGKASASTESEKIPEATAGTSAPTEADTEHIVISSIRDYVWKEGDWAPDDAYTMARVSLRSAPSIDAEKLTEIDAGHWLPVSVLDGDWAGVEYDGKTGYIHSDYLLPRKLVEQDLYTEHELPVPDMTGVDLSAPMVAITYDDGPQVGNTDQILDVLQEYGAKATFFMVGNNICGANMQTVRRMVELGCEVGNHSFGHDHFKNLEKEDIKVTLSFCNAAVRKACGVRPAVMRPPEGYYGDKAAQAVMEETMYAAKWSLDSDDWNVKDRDKTVANVLQDVKDGDIILMHDNHYWTADAAEEIIRELQNRGFQLVTVSQLVQAKSGVCEAGTMVHGFRNK